MTNTRSVHCIITYDTTGTVTSILLDGKRYKTGVSGFPNPSNFKSTDVAYVAIADPKDAKSSVDIHRYNGKKSTHSGFSE